MRFAFSEDQRMFQETLAELLVNECGHETLASAWETKDGFVPGQVSAAFQAGSWSDGFGNPSGAESELFHVIEAVAKTIG